MLSSSLQRSHDTNGEDVVGTYPIFVIHCMTRPFEYENLTLLQMAKKHYFSKNCWHKSKVESIVRIIPKLDGSELLENSENWELYCHQQVLLHHHYHSLAEAIGECETWTLRYVDLGLALNDCVNITDLVDKEYEVIEDIELQSEGVHLEEWMLAASMGPMFDYGEDVELGLRDFDTSHNWGECLERYSNIDIDRKFIHNHLGVTDDCNSELANNIVVVPLTHLSAQQRMVHDLVLASLHEQRPIHLIISGGAGTGKSTLINAIVHSTFILFHSNKAVRIMAPTGVAAFNIGGATIHHELAISAERKPSQPYIHISGDQCRRMQEDFKDTKLIIIDEYSMLGRSMLANVDLRCRDIFATNESFGGVSVILVGDMRQLPPVFDSPLYSNKGSYMQQCGTLAYSVFDKCIRLSYIFRQVGEDQASLREALHRLSDGTSTIEDWHMFKTRDYSTLTIEEMNNFRYALRLFPTKRAGNEYNRERLIQLGKLIARIFSKNNCETATKAESDQAKGLEKFLCISVGARVMLRANLATHNELVNGAMSTVVDIVYAVNCKSPFDSPLTIMVDFDNYRGISFRESSNIIPIPPITSNWKASTGTSCQRTQIPIILCWAITIHKSQGLTLDKAVVDIGEKESLGLTFVALSQTRRLQDLAFNPMFTYGRLQKIGKCDGLKGRRQEEERLRNIQICND
ncbi:ATP-dependent DNA helicase [Abeliophyllum distichum]|uniref:ATP-dependent DNA helicase n=1 Tax=Abeliophyllum distichum TaxID=126358 RepID=A0ABD1SE94_9LAMI